MAYHSFQRNIVLCFCPLAVFYGMLRAMMITGKARKTRSVVFPFWHRAFAPYNVVYRTGFGTFAASYAFVLSDIERLVCDEIFYKAAANETAVDFGHLPMTRSLMPFCALLSFQQSVQGLRQPFSFSAFLSPACQHP